MIYVPILKYYAFTIFTEPHLAFNEVTVGTMSGGI